MIGAGKIHLLFPKNKASSTYGRIKCPVELITLPNDFNPDDASLVRAQ